MANHNISPLLQKYLDGLTNPQLKAALVAKLQDNSKPTLKDIRAAMMQLGENTSNYPGVEDSKLREKKKHKQKLLARLKELEEIPNGKRTATDFSEMLAITQKLILHHPEAMERREG